MNPPISPKDNDLYYANRWNFGLSYTHLGKGRTEYVPPERLKEVKRQLENYRKFKELTQEWVTLAIELCKLKQTQQDNK